MATILRSNRRQSHDFLCRQTAPVIWLRMSSGSVLGILPRIHDRSPPHPHGRSVTAAALSIAAHPGACHGIVVIPETSLAATILSFRLNAITAIPATLTMSSLASPICTGRAVGGRLSGSWQVTRRSGDGNMLAYATTCMVGQRVGGDKCGMEVRDSGRLCLGSRLGSRFLPRRQVAPNPANQKDC